ncbi:MAG: LysR family transcriptional regulator [Gammaproteobacteria bacterium]|jgi:DNA-binding transcriptional LysR family regulator|nr:LysR family transcriptional regulator [Gammaproteobacteria bacterium]
MDTLTSINVFRQVVELGSFVRAAEQLDLSTAMVSKHVMSIEKRLRVRLLNRNSHKLSLTEPGRFYLERCIGILDDLEKTELELESLSSAPRGTLRIACCDTCIPSMGFAGVLAEYRRRWPEVVLDISFVDRAVDLVEEGYDVALCLVDDERLPGGMVARRVRPVPFRLAASRAYLQRNGTPKVPEDLGHHDFITTGDLNSVSLKGPLGTIEIPLRVALRCRTVADVAVTVAGGMGLALLPAALFNDSAFVNVLRPILTEFQLKQSTLYLLYPGRKYLPCKVRAFIDLALESGATNPEQTHTPAAANRTRPLPDERVQALAG